MKKVFYLPLLVAVLVLSSCCKTVPSFTKLIPEEADIVLRLDVRQMSKKTGFTKNDEMKDKAREFIKNEFSGKFKEKMLAILDDPAEAGLDLRDPVFVYNATESKAESFGVVGAVWKANRFTELLNAIAQEWGEEKVHTGDVNYVTLQGMLICYTDDWFFITSFNEDWQDAKAVARDIAKRYDSDKKSIADNPGFRKMCEKKGLVQLFMKGEAVGELAKALIGFGQSYDYTDDWQNVEEEVMAVAEEAVDPAFDTDSIIWETDTTTVAIEDEVPPSESDMESETESDMESDFMSDDDEIQKSIERLLGFRMKDVALIFDFSMGLGNAALTAQLTPVADDAKAQLKELDANLGGKQEGFCFRLNFGMLKQLARHLDQIETSESVIMQMAAKFVKYVELKYEGNCTMALTLKTVNQDKTPLQSLIDTVSSYLDLL